MNDWIYLPDLGISINLGHTLEIVWNNQHRDGTYGTLVVIDPANEVLIVLSSDADRVALRNKFFTNPQDCEIKSGQGVIMLASL